MDNNTILRSLQTMGVYTGPVDGEIGPEALAAIDAALGQKLTVPFQMWPPARKVIAIKQLILNEMDIDSGEVDGLMGPTTQAAIEQWQGLVRTAGGHVEDAPVTATVWPTQAQVPSFYGPMGQHQVDLHFPYPMKIAWNLSEITHKTKVHEKCHDAFARGFQKVLETYGQAAISQLRLDYFGGCLNVRKMRGTNAWSMHSWGIAMDIDPERNQLRWGRDRAIMAKSEYEPFWAIWEAEGAVSLGRARNYDWMHFQFARL